jgi:hypothetical protein
VWLLSGCPDTPPNCTTTGRPRPPSPSSAVGWWRFALTPADRTAFGRGTGSVTWLAPGVIHDVRGGGREPSVSIHSYSPPLRQMHYYTAAGRDRLRLARSVPTDQPEEPIS